MPFILIYNSMPKLIRQWPLRKTLNCRLWTLYIRQQDFQFSDGKQHFIGNSYKFLFVTLLGLQHYLHYLPWLYTQVRRFNSPILPFFCRIKDVFTVVRYLVLYICVSNFSLLGMGFRTKAFQLPIRSLQYGIC